MEGTHSDASSDTSSGITLRTSPFHASDDTNFSHDTSDEAACTGIVEDDINLEEPREGTTVFPEDVGHEVTIMSGCSMEGNESQQLQGECATIQSIGIYQEGNGNLQFITIPIFNVREVEAQMAAQSALSSECHVLGEQTFGFPLFDEPIFQYPLFQEPTLPEYFVEEPMLSEYPVQERTPPEYLVEEPMLAEYPVEERTPPEYHVEESILPEYPVEERTLPEYHVEEPTLSECPVEERTPPEYHVEEPTLSEYSVDESFYSTYEFPMYASNLKQEDLPSPSHRGPRRRSSKVDTRSFRYIVGPHLRILSSVLDLSGLKDLHFVPYQMIRRFHPTDMYRTMEKCISNFNSTPAVGNVEPDWSQLGIGAEENLTYDWSDFRERLYYKCPFGTDKPDLHSHMNLVSIPKQMEENGKLLYSPEVLTSVGSAELNVALNLRTIAEKCVNTELKMNASRVGPLRMNLKEPNCVGLLYESGQIIVTGVQSYEDFRLAVRKFARMVQKTGLNVRLTKLNMHFHVGWIKLPFGINLEAMMKHEYLSKFLLYDPQIFPGVVFRMNNSCIMCLVFDSGAVLMTEASGLEEMKNALDKIYPILRLFGRVLSVSPVAP